MKTNEELLKENAELKLALGIAASFPTKVRMECRKRIDSKLVSLDFITMLHESANLALNKTPAQHLADIKADAQEELTSMMRDDLRKHIAKASGTVDADFLISLKFTDRMVQEYANKLRGEAK